ncbi:uncharacterized protein LOC142222505 [Haematobia irritans]|uniref:uncharacterized protein LOC142222505 n=1 Tax=Haematobia irritans TaxID=7368 RepID=UPI003F50C305
MQTAVDCNGSSSNSTTTTITTTQTERGNETPMTQHLLVQNSNSSTTTITTDHGHETPSSAPPIATNVLRHRMTTSAIAHNSNGNTNTHGDMKAPKNGLTHLLDANAHIGGEYVSLTPSATPSPPSSSCLGTPQASPSKRDKCKLMQPSLDYHDPMGESYKGNTTTSSSPSPSVSASASSSALPPPEPCSSKTTSNSTSTTSSVIATPIAKRNGNVFKDPKEDDNTPASAHDGNRDGDGSVAASPLIVEGDGSNKTQQQQHEKSRKNQMLPVENTSSLSNNSKKEMSSDPVTPPPPVAMTMSSSTTSSSINSNASNASSSPASSAPSSPDSSSSATTTSSITPPASAIIPALLSPSTPTSTATSSASSSPGTSVAPGSPATPPASSSGKGFSFYGDFDAELLQWQDMPQYLQFNPYVLKGYRPLQTFKGCLLSLFYWHNETINILTHAIPIVYILAIVPGLMPWESGYRFLSFCHVFGSVAPWCGSFIYHLFMNIERGENVYYTLLKLDMVGIWVSQSFGALPLVTATTFCFSTKWKWLIILSYCLFSLWGLYKALTASSPWQRRLCFALPFTMRSLLTFFRTAGVVGGNPVALPHVILQDAVSVIGGAIGAMRIPEKWFPGLVDFYLNSHNIMHVLVVIAVYSMHMATVKDFEWMSNTNCEAFTNATSKVLESTLNSNVEL